MRITGGILKGRQILFPKNSNIRPTTDKVRSALFSILGDIIGYRILDICCGTGSFGIEALSRGASHVTFIDLDTNPLKLNTPLLKEFSFSVIKGDFIKKLALIEDKFDIIFLDPPYQKYSLNVMLEAIYNSDIMSDEGVLIIEESKKIIIPAEHPLKLIDKRIYGDTSLLFFKKN